MMKSATEEKHSSPVEVNSVGIDDADVELRGVLREDLLSAVLRSHYGGPVVEVLCDTESLYVSQVEPTKIGEEGVIATYYRYPVSTKKDSRSLFSLRIERSQLHALRSGREATFQIHFYKVTKTFNRASEWKALIRWIVPGCNLKKIVFTRLDFFVNVVEPEGESLGTTALPRNFTDTTDPAHRDKSRSYGKRKSGRITDYDVGEAAEARGYDADDVTPALDPDDPDIEHRDVLREIRKEVGCQKQRLLSLVRKAVGKTVPRVNFDILLWAARMDMDPYYPHMKFVFKPYPASVGTDYEKKEKYYRANVNVAGMQPAYTYASRENLVKTWFNKVSYYDKLGPALCKGLVEFLEA